MNCGDRIKRIREIFKMTQKDMAKELGISQAYLCNIESGKNQVNAEVIFKLTVRFGVKTLWLAEGVGEMFVFPVKKAASLIREKESFYSFLDEIYSQLDSGKLISFSVDSDNMEPLFYPGEVVLIDTTDTEPEHLSIYLFETEFRTFLKRFIGGGIMKLTNDNPALKNNDLIMTSSVKCLGKAVWVIKKVE